MCLYETKIRLLKAFTVYLLSQVILFTLFLYFVLDYNLIKSLLVTMPLALFISVVFLIFDKFVCSSEEN